jgi:hypothetical protein
MQVERAALDYGSGRASGERVSNTSVTCPLEGDNRWKRRLKPHDLVASVVRGKTPVLKEGPAAYQVVGGVRAHQADDGKGA